MHFRSTCSFNSLPYSSGIQLRHLKKIHNALHADQHPLFPRTGDEDCTGNPLAAPEHGVADFN